MAKLIMAQGLPGSGKSKWALEFIHEQKHPWVIVNKDDIRLELSIQGWKWSPEAEQDVINARDAQISGALKHGCSVISSDTNFGQKHLRRLAQLAAEHGAEFEVKRFDVPLEECLRRNALREGKARIPDQAIRDMYYKYVVKDTVNYPLSARPEAKLEPVRYEYGLKTAIICDLDGTLAINDGHRDVFDFSTCDQDGIYAQVKRCIEVYYRFMGFDIVYMTGREEKYREQTEAFLRQHHCPPGPLYMRNTGDSRKDSIIKRELFDAHVRGKYNVEFCLDDRDQVVEMWRGIGLKCWQVAPGNF